MYTVERRSTEHRNNQHLAIPNMTFDSQFMCMKHTKLLADANVQSTGIENVYLTNMQNLTGMKTSYVRLTFFHGLDVVRI